jgi:hypothetical protein
MWEQERTNSASNLPGAFSMCCGGGKVILPLLQAPPPLLARLSNGQDRRSQHFFNNSRRYNCMLQMASHKLNRVIYGGVQQFKVSGQLHQYVGSITPAHPVYIQQYITDPSMDAAAAAGQSWAAQLDADLLRELRTCIADMNPNAQEFRAAAVVAIDAPDYHLVYCRPSPNANWLERHTYAPPAIARTHNEVSLLMQGTWGTLPIHVHPRSSQPPAQACNNDPSILAQAHLPLMRLQPGSTLRI